MFTDVERDQRHQNIMMKKIKKKKKKNNADIVMSWKIWLE